MKKIKEEHKVIVITILAIFFIWSVDAAYDSWFADEGTFVQLLLNLNHREPFLRTLMSLGFLVFGVIIARILSKHSLAEQALKKQSAAMETSLDGIAIYNHEMEYVYVNQAYASINGYANPREVIGKKCGLTYDDKEMERMMQVVEPALEKGGRWRGELVARRKNGSTYYQEASATRLEDGGRVCIIRDITWRKRSEERLRKSERFLNMIFDSIRDPFCIFDNEFRVIRANEAYASMKNTKVDDLIGRKCFETLTKNTRICEGCIVDKSFNSADPCAKEKQIELKDGTSIWIEIYTYPILDEEGNVSHVMEYTRDVTERKKAEEEKQRLIERLEYLSRTDSLTGLMNRRALTDSLIYEFDRARRYQTELSLVLCDIDNFKEINDTCGHDTGDRALQAISAMLKTILRKADIAGRYGGDEFMLILPATSIQGAESLADKLLTVVRSSELPFQDCKPLRLSMSIGVAVLRSDDMNIDALIKRTDDAMYVSKQEGRDRITSGKV